MTRRWTFGQKVGAGFAITVALAIGMGGVSVYALRNVVASKDRVITIYAENIIDGERLSDASSRKVSALRAFLLVRGDENLKEMNKRREEFRTTLAGLRSRMDSSEERSFLDRIEGAEEDHQAAAVRVIGMRKGDGSIEAAARVFDEEVAPKRDSLVSELDAFLSHEVRIRDAARQAASDSASASVQLVVAISFAVVLSAGLIAWVLTRSLGRQIGTAVGQMQSS